MNKVVNNEQLDFNRPDKLGKQLEQTGSVLLMSQMSAYISQHEFFWRNKAFYPLVTEYTKSTGEKLEQIFDKISALISWLTPIFIIENSNKRRQYFVTVVTDKEQFEKFYQELEAVQEVFDVLNIHTNWNSMTESKSIVQAGVTYWGITFTL